MPHLPPDTFYNDIPTFGMLQDTLVQVYVKGTGRWVFRYRNGIRTNVLLAFPLAVGTTRGHKVTGQGCLKDVLKHQVQIHSKTREPWRIYVPARYHVAILCAVCVSDKKKNDWSEIVLSFKLSGNRTTFGNCYFNKFKNRVY